LFKGLPKQLSAYKQTKQPLFAEINLTGDEFRQSPSTHMQRTRFLKLVYPNDVTLILPSDISASQLEQYIHIKVQGYRNPVMVRKDDIDQKFHIAPVHEELIWKSYASNNLLAQLEVRKYMDHMPFNRQRDQG